mmetsp:Transcript_158940/g.506102  ORF Transcript_158940/g.506102 Transcript_158940/m.506102 type:complete len:221 (+) Transcript_158940:341-1003(+)
MQQLRDNVPLPLRLPVRAHADEAADVRVLERRHDLGLLEELVQAHAVVPQHLLDSHDLLQLVSSRHCTTTCRARRGRCCRSVRRRRRRRRRQHAPEDDAEAALGDRGRQRQPLQGDHASAKAGVVHHVTQAAAPRGVGVAVRLEEVLQSPAHDQALEGGDEAELLTHAGVRQLHDLQGTTQARAGQSLGGHRGDAEAAHHLGQLWLPPEHRRGDHRQAAP